MADDTEQMRARIEQHRNEITHTVDQIGNRVNPSHIVARRQDRMRRRMTGWKDSVFGNDDPEYAPFRGEINRFPETPAYGQVYGNGNGNADGGVRERAGEAASNVTSSVQHAPSAIRRQTRGNPMAAGALALGAGWLIGSVLPESRREKQAIKRVEPKLAEVATEARDEARGLADDLREPAKEAVDQVKDAGSHAAADVKDQAAQSAQTVREHAGS